VLDLQASIHLAEVESIGDRIDKEFYGPSTNIPRINKMVKRKIHDFRQLNLPDC